jgi:hypothetical protein
VHAGEQEFAILSATAMTSRRPPALRTLALALMLVALPQTVPSARADITSNLVGHWKLDDTAATTTAIDSSGNGNTGTMTNMTGAANTTTGRKGNALTFNGWDELIAVPNSGSLNPTTAMTASAWVYITPGSLGTNHRRILQKGNGDDQYRLTFEEPLKFGVKVGGTMRDVAITEPSTGAWHMVTGTYDGANIKIYIDGTLANSVAQTGNISTTTDPLYIASKNNGNIASDDFMGTMDDVRIYSRALSAADVTQLYNARNGPFTGPIACNASYAGVMIYNDDEHVMQYCNGSSWIAMGKEGMGCPSGYIAYDGSCYSIRSGTTTSGAGLYGHWAGGQPDGGTGQNCALLWNWGSGEWHDDPCTNAFYYACEKPLGGGCTGNYSLYGGKCYDVRAPTNPAYYSNWANTGEGAGGTGENCAAKGGWAGGKWYDTGCGDNVRYICERATASAGYTLNSGRYYKYVNSTATWAAARTACQADGGDLVKIGSAATETFLQTLYSAGSTDVWIGLTDAASESNWLWPDATTALSTKTWAQARTACQADGGDLVTIPDSGTDTFIKSLYDEDDEPVWMGATDSASEGDWRWPDNSVVSAPLTWSEARTACQAEGGDLIKVANAGVQTFLSGLYDDDTDKIWLGMTDNPAVVGAATEGNWYWMDGTSIASTYDNFYGGEGTGGTGEQCTSIWDGNDGKWVDSGCGDRYYYGCEIAGAGGTGSGTCSSPSGIKGEVNFNGATGQMQYCNGNVWVAMGPATSAGAPANGLVGYWTLDDTANTTTAIDSSGSGLNGTMTSMTGAANTATGKVATALNFDGSSDYITVADNNALDLTQYTLTAWVKSDAGPNGSIMKIVDKENNYSMNWSHFNGGPKCEHNDGGGFDTTAGAATHPATGTWYFIVCTYDGANIKTYLDGTLVSSVASGTPVTSSTVLAIGSYYSGNYKFDGLIDDVRIYNRPLSATEISDAYTATSGSYLPSAGLIHYWAMDDNPASGTLVDSAGSANCTIANGTPTSVSGPNGNAINFANGPRAECGVLSDLNGLTTMTVSAWLKRNATSALVSIGSTADQNNQITINFWQNGVLYTGVAKNGNGNYDDVYKTLNDTSWHHIVMVYDGTQGTDTNRIKTYIDGTLATGLTYDGARPAAVETQTKQFQIGSNHLGGNPGPDNGQIDDVRIYNRALSASEVMSLYGACTSPTGRAGEMVYNTTNHIMQYCNGTNWIGVGKTP